MHAAKQVLQAYLANEYPGFKFDLSLLSMLAGVNDQSFNEGASAAEVLYYLKKRKARLRNTHGFEWTIDQVAQAQQASCQKAITSASLLSSNQTTSLKALEGIVSKMDGKVNKIPLNYDFNIHHLALSKLKEDSILETIQAHVPVALGTDGHAVTLTGSATVCCGSQCTPKILMRNSWGEKESGWVDSRRFLEILRSASLPGITYIQKCSTDAGESEVCSSDGYTSNEPLHLMAHFGDIKQIQKLTRSGIKTEDRDDEGHTALHFASTKNRGQKAAHVIQALIAGGADSNAMSKLGSRPIHFAAEAGSVEAIKALHQAHADLEARNEYGHGALYFAAKEGRSAAIKALQDAGVKLNDGNGQGKTSLHTLAQDGSLNGIKTLAVAGADLDVTDNYGDTAFDYAAKGDHFDAVGALIAAGAHINMQSKESGTTALHRAVHRLKDPADLTALGVFLGAGADPTLRDSQGKAPFDYLERPESLLLLKWAASNGLTKVVRAIADAKKIKLESPLENGWTMLQSAAFRDDSRAIATLVKAGAKVDVRQSNGMRALDTAAYNGIVHAIQALIKAGANPHGKDKDGDNALHYAAMEGQVGSIQGLLLAGARVDEKNHSGATALQTAAGHGHSEAVELLARKGAQADGANINEQNQKGWTALRYAVSEDKYDVIQVLLAAGADPNLGDEKGKLPFDFAKSRRVKALLAKAMGKKRR